MFDGGNFSLIPVVTCRGQQTLKTTNDASHSFILKKQMKTEMKSITLTSVMINTVITNLTS